MTATIKNTERLTIPSDLRREAAFKAGENLEFRVAHRVIMIVPKPKRQSPLAAALRATQEKRQTAAKHPKLK